MQRTKKLPFLPSGSTRISIVFPFIVISPAYFAGAVQLGGLMQTASAFTSVQTALSFFVNAYRSLAEWRAGVEPPCGVHITARRGRGAGTPPPPTAGSRRQGAEPGASTAPLV